MKKPIVLLLTVIATAILYSCGGNMKEHADKETADSSQFIDSSATGEVPPSTDSIAANPQENRKVDTVVRRDSDRKDTGPIIPHPASQKAMGNLVYYCPHRMLEKSDNNVSVTITKAELEKAVTQLAERVAATTGKTTESVRENIDGSAIAISERMKVELKYSDKDFETIYKPENAEQHFNGTDDMNWDWIIKPLRVGKISLSIIVSGYDAPSGQWVTVQSPPKIFEISVQVDPRNYFSKLWGFLGDHPEWIFVQVLFPVIAYLFGRRQGKKAAG